MFGKSIERPVLLLAGVAEGLGASIAVAFAAAGYNIAGLARTDRVAKTIAAPVGKAGGTYIHRICDVTQPKQVADAVSPYAERVGVLVYNAHALSIKGFADTTVEEFEHIWRVTFLGAVIAASAVLPHMVARGNGTIIFTGATAGIRGGKDFAAFASAKFALRGLGQSLAREFGPKGVHVAHVVLDGLIDEEQSERRFGPSKSERMNPGSLADAYLSLTTQHPSAWTQELDLRPSREHF